MSRELITQFVSHLTESGKSYSTVIAYRKDLEQLHANVDKDLVELTRDDLVKALADLQKQYNFTVKTVSRKLNSFRTFFKYLQNEGHISQNFAEQVDHPKVASKPPRILSQLEYLALREVSRSNLRLHAMIELMLQSGIRIGELSRIKVHHLDLDKAAPQLFIEEYSTIPARHIPLTPRAHQVTMAYLESMKGKQSDTPLFPTRDGKHMIIRNIRSSVDRAMQKAGIADACVNDLRNTFIVSQLRSGVPVDVIADAVGHRSKTTTQKYLELLEAPYSPSGESKLVDV